MSKTIHLPDELYARLAGLARPFLDKEPADVIRRLVEKESSQSGPKHTVAAAPPIQSTDVLNRVPRERGAIVELDGTAIHADSVPDLCKKVMEYMFAKGHGEQVLGLAPYKTSAQRYLFAKTPKHPNGNEFFVPIKCHGLYVEAHKNYKTSITQLARFAAKCGVSLTYKGT